MSLYGEMYSFSNVVVTFNGVPLVTCTAIDYATNRPWTQNIGAQGRVVGVTLGSEAPTVSLTMSKDEWNVVLSASPNGKSSGLRDFDILVSMQNGTPRTDRIRGCYINSAPTSIAEGDGGITVALDITCTGIDENV